MLLKEQRLSLRFQIGSVCNNALIVDENLHGSPTEGALLAFAMKMGVYNARHQFRRIQVGHTIFTPSKT